MANSNAVIGTIIRASRDASLTSEFANIDNIVQQTRSQFRPNQSSSGRPQKSTFKKKVFLLKLANSDFLPGNHEKQFLKERGLGLQPNQIEIARNWNYFLIKRKVTEILQPNVQDLLKMADFIFCKSDKQRKILPVPFDNGCVGRDLEEMVGSGIIIIKPFHDFPNDLPVISISLDDQQQKAVFLNEALMDDELYNTGEQAGTSTITNESTGRRTRQQRTLISMSTPIHVSDVVHDTSLGSSISSSTSMEMSNVNTLLRGLAPETEYVEVEKTLSQDFCFPKLVEDSPLEVLTVQRTNLMDELFRIYKTKNNLDQYRLSVIFKNEEGIDGGGLTTELFTIFWTQAFSSFQYFRGHDALVPHTPLHKFRKLLPDFQILAKILGHMIITVGQFPNRLALYVLYGISGRPKEEYPEKLLLQDFFLFVTPAERKLVKKALIDYDNLNNHEISRLTNFMTANGLFDIPRKEQLMDQLTTIAEKVIIKDPQDLYTEMRKAIHENVLKFLKNVPIGDLESIWCSLQATPEKVMNILKLTDDFITNEQEKTFFFLQNYVGSLTKLQLSNFLTFVTGSVNMPDYILVEFHNQLGLGRRPIVHTCSNIIELAANFDNQQEFEAEMNIVLNDVQSYEYDQV